QKNWHPCEAKKHIVNKDAKGNTEPPELVGSPREAELSPADAESKRAVRLGEIFYARRRWAAAAKEYGRARSRMPLEVPQVARRYAYSEIQLGHYAEAEEALRSAAERDPEDEAVQSRYAQA